MKLGKVLYNHVTYDECDDGWNRYDYIAKVSEPAGERQEAFKFYNTTQDIIELFNSNDFTFGLIHTPKMRIVNDVLCTILTLEDAIESAGKNLETLEDYLQSIVGSTTRGLFVKIVQAHEKTFILTVKDPSFFSDLNAIAQMSFAKMRPKDIGSQSGKNIHDCNLAVGFKLTELNAEFVQVSEYTYGLIQEQFETARNEMMGNRMKVQPSLISDPQKELISYLQKEISNLDEKLSNLQIESKPTMSGYSKMAVAAISIAVFGMGLLTNEENFNTLISKFT